MLLFICNIQLSNEHLAIYVLTTRVELNTDDHGNWQWLVLSVNKLHSPSHFTNFREHFIMKNIPAYLDCGYYMRTDTRRGLMSTFAQILVVTQFIPCVVSYRILNCCVPLRTLGPKELGNVILVFRDTNFRVKTTWKQVSSSERTLLYGVGKWLFREIYTAYIYIYIYIHIYIFR